MPNDPNQFTELTLALRTLTPLWTGDANQQMDRVHETGLLGSLRWWYEALVRWAGGQVCDPAGDIRCSFNQKTFDKAEGDDASRLRQAGVCDVCQLFGATGWRRRFRLQVEVPSGTPSPLAVESPRPCRNGPDTCRLQPHGNPWIIKPGMAGDFNLCLIGESHDLAAIAGLLAWVAPRGAIGARTQLGYGVFAFRQDPPDDAKFVQRLLAMRGVAPPNPSRDTLPNVAHMFRARLALDALRDPMEPSGLRDFPVVELLQTKSELRHAFREPAFAQPPGTPPISPDNLRALRHRTLGTVHGDDRWASRVHLSRPYRRAQGDLWTMRIWAWLPDSDEAEVLSRLNAYLDSRNPGLKLVEMGRQVV